MGYTFISYSHKDIEIVERAIKFLRENNLELWYDAGIEAGVEWPTRIGNALKNCDSIISFMSRTADASQNCRNEINMALKLQKQMLVVYLEDFELSPGLELQLGTIQSIYRTKCISESQFFNKIQNAMTWMIDSSKETAFYDYKKQDIEKKAKLEDFDIDSDGILYDYKGKDEEVIIPSRVVEIASYAFSDFFDMKSLVFEKNSKIENIEHETFKDCDLLEGVKLPASIKRVGENAFDTKIMKKYGRGYYLPTEISDYGFLYGPISNEVTSLVVHPDCHRINTCMLYSDEDLESISVSEENKYYSSKDGALYNKDKTEIVFIPKGIERLELSENLNLTTIEKEMFLGYSNLKRVKIPNTVKSIKTSAFRACFSLEEVEIPKSVLTIEDYAFAFCKKLTKITIPSSVVSIVGSNVFTDNWGLTIYCDLASRPEGWDNRWNSGCKVVWKKYEGASEVKAQTQPIQKEKPIIPSSAPAESSSVKNNSLGSNSDLCDKCTSKENVVQIPQGVQKIGKSAYSNNQKIQKVIIPEGVVEIEKWAFVGCSELAVIEIPQSLLNIGEGVFGRCPKIENIIVHSANTNYKSIDGSLYSKDGRTLICYARGKRQTEFTVPDGVVEIAEEAFAYSEYLQEVKTPSSLVKISRWAFSYCPSIKKIYLSNSVADVQSGINSCKNLENIVVEEDNPYFKTIDGNVYSKDGKTIVRYTPGKKQNEFSIPDGVTHIGASAFAFCKNLLRVKIPDTLTHIEDFAFSSCEKINSMVIPKSVQKIAESAFRCCYRLVEVYNLSNLKIESGNKDYADLLKRALVIRNDLNTLSTLSVDNGYVICTLGLEKILVDYIGTQTELILPSYVTKINPYAFANCREVTKFVLPGGVKSIGTEAFFNCENAKSINIPSSVVKIENFAFEKCVNLKIYCEARQAQGLWDRQWNKYANPVVWGSKGP